MFESAGACFFPHRQPPRFRILRAIGAPDRFSKELGSYCAVNRSRTGLQRAFPIRFKRTSGSSRQPGSNRNDSGRRHRSKRKKLLRNEPGQSRPKSAPVSGQPFTRSCACALMAGETTPISQGPSAPREQIFALHCFAAILNYYTLL